MPYLSIFIITHLVYNFNQPKEVSNELEEILRCLSFPANLIRDSHLPSPRLAKARARSEQAYPDPELKSAMARQDRPSGLGVDFRQ